MTKRNDPKLIDSFITSYYKLYDFYDQAARLVAQILEERLNETGIRSIVTSRAKSPRSLEPKVRQRALKKKYSCEEDIFNDLVDLAGVRVAMYFPGDQKQVDSIIQSLFSLHGDPKKFPEKRKKTKKSKYEKRFSGYFATHYRVQLKEDNLIDTQKRYTAAKIEIQVASVLMHAWSEVEHDLIYKPQQGELSYEEYSILDKINGMVMAGEIALELLQSAGKARIAQGGRSFKNHYDLASHILSTIEPYAKHSNQDTALGRIDLLYELLKQLDLGTPDKLKFYLQSLSSDLEKSPLAEQIINQLVSNDTKNFEIYKRLRTSQSKTNDYSKKVRGELNAETQKEFGLFLQQWSNFEKEAGEIARKLNIVRNYLSSAFLSKLGIKNEKLLADFDQIRRMRNEVVHGRSFPTIEEFKEAESKLQEIMDELRQL